MFTPTGEFPVHMRMDNADRRVAPYGRRLGLINDEAWVEYEQKQARMAALEKLLATRKVDAVALTAHAPDLGLSGIAGLTWAQLLKPHEVTIEPVMGALADDLRK